MPSEPNENTVEVNQPSAELDLPEGVPPLRSLYLYVSGSCNLACRHCWIVPEYHADAADGQHVDLDHVRKAIRQGKPLGLNSIKLTGGEPLLHTQFRELVRLIDEAELDITIETNGTLIDDDLARFLTSTPHLSFVSISLDGSTAETHDILRGVRGSHERAIAGIKALVRAGYQPQIICTLHRGNVSQIDEIVTLAEDLGCSSIKFNLIQEVGRGEQFAEEQGLSVDECIRLNQHAEDVLVSRDSVEVFFDIPLAFRPFTRLLRGSLGRCGILGILGMLSSGELSLCGIGVTVPELIYGHIERDDLREVWCYSPGLVEMRKLVPAQLQGICAQCLHRDMCLGSCVANNFHATGRLDAPYQFCERAEAQGLFPASRKK